MRMFWACTHVTLRNVEVPILLDAGFEVVPEEVNLDFLVADEARLYDDPDLPANRRWRAACTAPEPELTVCRRARLFQQRGLPSQEARQAFNSTFDVIYVSTFLDVAVNVACWFNGEVVFRYFGSFTNIRTLKEMARGIDRRRTERLVCLPIFDTLFEDGVADIFDRAMTLHTLIDDRDSPPPWTGVRDGQSAVVVLSSLYEGWETLDLLRGLAPLAERIPIRVLGRSDLARVPQDVKALFDIRGGQDAEAHFRAMSQARLLIYPNASRRHMHYVPLEALAAGVPIVCRDTIPLIVEAEAAGMDFGSMPGVCRSHSDLMDRAADFFLQPEQLADVAARQAPLKAVHARCAVVDEARALKARLRPPVRARRDALAVTPLSLIPNRRVLDATDQIAAGLGEVPVSHLLHDPAAARLTVAADAARADVVLTDATPPCRMMLGFGRERFAPDRPHRIRVSGSATAGADLRLDAEVWLDQRMSQSTAGVLTDIRPDGRVELTIEFQADRAASLLLSARVTGTGQAALTLLRHETPDAAGALRIGGDALDLTRGRLIRLRSPQGLAARFLAPEVEAVRPLHLPDGSVVPAWRLPVEPAPIIFNAFDTTDPERPNALRLRLHAPETATLGVVIELWEDGVCIARRRSSLTLSGGASELQEAALPEAPPAPEMTLVVYLAPENPAIHLIDLRLDEHGNGGRDRD